MHSFWSDGQDFPEMIARWFRRQGYHFIAFTEHDQLQEGEKWVSLRRDDVHGRVILAADLMPPYREAFGTEWVQEHDGKVRIKPVAEYRKLVEEAGRFLILNGEEISSRWSHKPAQTGSSSAGMICQSSDGQSWLEGMHHINAFNLSTAVPPPEVKSTSVRAINAARQAAIAQGPDVLVSFNHPNFQWNATAEDIAASELTCMEMFTALTSCNSYGDDRHASAMGIWDIANTLRRRDGRALIYGLASDDSHVYSLINWGLGRAGLPGRAWVMVRAQHLTATALIAALRQGDFYASSGVELATLQQDGNGITLHVREQPGVRYTVRFIGTLRGFVDRCEPVLDEHGRPMRVTRRYSDDVGRVLATVTGPHAQYRFTGEELFVRAEILSDAVHPMPSRTGDFQRAWTQPVAV